MLGYQSAPEIDIYAVFNRIDIYSLVHAFWRHGIPFPLVIDKQSAVCCLHVMFDNVGVKHHLAWKGPEVFLFFCEEHIRRQPRAGVDLGIALVSDDMLDGVDEFFLRVKVAVIWIDPLDKLVRVLILSLCLRRPCLRQLQLSVQVGEEPADLRMDLLLAALYRDDGRHVVGQKLSCCAAQSSEYLYSASYEVICSLGCRVDEYVLS